MKLKLRKEIGHVLIDGRWIFLQNCRVYRSAQFLKNYHRLVVASLKLRLISKRTVSSQPWLDVGMLKDERLSEEFVNRLSGRPRGLVVSGDAEKLWSVLHA